MSMRWFGNRYVLRMQAAFALMDWVARELPPGSPQGSVWSDWSGPETGVGWYSDNRRARQAQAARILGEVLDGNEPRCRSLEGYVQAALGLTANDTQAVLWDPPRPLMTSVIPTILRRLESGWRRVQAHAATSHLVGALSAARLMGSIASTGTAHQHQHRRQQYRRHGVRAPTTSATFAWWRVSTGSGRRRST